MTKTRIYGLTLLVGGLLALPLFLIHPRTAEAAESSRGWTIVQGGSETVYKVKDRWTGNAVGGNSFLLRNEPRGMSVSYFGSFQVIHREKGD